VRGLNSGQLATVDIGRIECLDNIVATAGPELIENGFIPPFSDAAAADTLDPPMRTGELPQ
jgi:hypothetical protein